MKHRLPLMVLTSLIAGSFGCHSDKPHDVGQMRPSVSDLDSRDRGLQSKDLVEASDLMAQSLIGLPELNASKAQWNIVVMSDVENQTTTRQNYGIFIDRLKTLLSKQGRGRISLIENKDRFHAMQSKELETGSNDQFGQGSGQTSGLPAGIQPDFALYSKAQEMDNRGTSTFRLEFTLVDFHTRRQVWSDEYLVRVAR